MDKDGDYYSPVTARAGGATAAGRVHFGSKGVSKVDLIKTWVLVFIVLEFYIIRDRIVG